MEGDLNRALCTVIGCPFAKLFAKLSGGGRGLVTEGCWWMGRSAVPSRGTLAEVARGARPALFSLPGSLEGRWL